MAKTTLTPTAEAALELVDVGDDIRFHVRAGTHDPMIVEEHWRGRSYASKLCLQPDDIVLDIGAHIGTFAVRAGLACTAVYCYEPDPGNYELLVRNLAENGLEGIVVPRQRAVVGNDDVLRTLYVSPAGRTSASSFHVRRGRQPVAVFADNINDVLRDRRPTVVKMDCEGAEAELLPAIEDWSGIRELTLEYHVSMLHDGQLSRYFELLGLLEEHFPRVDAPRHHSGAWTRDIYACR